MENRNYAANNPDTVETVKQRGDGKGRFDVRQFHPGNLLSQQQQAHLAKELIQPGKTIDDLLMRIELEDPNMALNAALAFAWCDEFGLEQQKLRIRYYLQALCSVKGKHALMYMQASTGIIAPSLMGARDDNRKPRGTER